MKTRTLLFVLCFPFLTAAQFGLPSLRDAVRKFHQTYHYVATSSGYSLAYARKANGWYVYEQNIYSDAESPHQLFLRLDGSTVELTGFMRSNGTENLQPAVRLLLSGAYSAYGFERNRYYGYRSWDADMINDFGTADPAVLNDTLLEGLAHAYSHYSNRFLWYHVAGGPLYADSLHQPLKRDGLPTQQRMDSVQFYLERSIGLYKVLAQRSPAYRTLAGNAPMKLFNEQLHAWIQYRMAGFHQLGEKTMRGIKPDSTLLYWSKNFMDSIPPNSILFTSMENDTYPLWFVQQAFGYRQDVAVVNTNLLGFPPYTRLLKKTGLVSFAATEEQLTSTKMLYFLHDRTLPNAGNFMELDSLLFLTRNAIYTRRRDDNSEILYPTRVVSWIINNRRIPHFSRYPFLAPAVDLVFGDFIRQDEWVLFDIMQQNIYRRPLYSTANLYRLRKFMLPLGNVWRFLPLDSAKQSERAKVEKIAAEEAVRNQWIGVQADPHAAMPSGLTTQTYLLYADLMQHHIEKRNRWAAIKTGKELIKKYPGGLPFAPGLDVFLVKLVEAGHGPEMKKLLSRYAEQIAIEMEDPSEALWYVDRTMARSLLQRMQSILTWHRLSNVAINNLLNRLAY